MARKPVNARHDLKAMEREFITGPWSTLTEYFKKYRGMRHSQIRLFRIAKQREWLRKREEMQNRVTQKAIDKHEGVLLKEWERQYNLLKNIEKQVSFILETHMDKDGNVTSSIEPSELKSLAEVVSKSVVTQRHMKGEDVHGDVNVSLTQNNLSLAIAKRSEEIEKQNALEVGPTILRPPE